MIHQSACGRPGVGGGRSLALRHNSVRGQLDDLTSALGAQCFSLSSRTFSLFNAHPQPSMLELSSTCYIHFLNLYPWHDRHLRLPRLAFLQPDWWEHGARSSAEVPQNTRRRPRGQAKTSGVSVQTVKYFRSLALTRLHIPTSSVLPTVSSPYLHALPILSPPVSHPLAQG